MDKDRSNDPVISRRQFLDGGVALGAAALTVRGDVSTTITRAAAAKPAGSDLGAIKHVIFLMQENRSFDHYFGSYKGVRGYDDHPTDSLGTFAQSFPLNFSRSPTGVQLPFHLDTSTGLGACTFDLTHNWLPQHLCWDNGDMDAFVQTHTSSSYEGNSNGLLTMGYYTRTDLPYHYALADAFTICDAYHCSIMGPTHPNRLMAMSGTIDPDGHHGGPVLITSSSPDALFSVTWDTVPELLEEAGISWKTYTPPGKGYVPGQPDLGFGDAILPYFAQYRKPSSSLYKKAFLPQFPNDFAHDVKKGTLPSVSWIIPPNGYDEHPPAPSSYGAWFIDRVLRTLVSNTKVWESSVVFVMYDENDGFFDHVAPPIAPAGTPGEYITVNPLPYNAFGIPGPLGLGFRVPMLVISPFSRGGYVASATLDHTSQIKFLEERFGIHCSNISAWRRQTVGDLTTTLHMSSASRAWPNLPATSAFRTEAFTVEGCTPGDISEENTTQSPYPLAATQVMPTQEPGTARRLP